MASIDEDLVVVDGNACVGSRCWSSNSRFLVFFDVFVAFDSLPDISFCLEEPAIVQTAALVSMTAENEDSLVAFVVYCGVLGARSWELISLAL